ncbi:MAG: TIGR00270 family protein [Candidatus Micrarchaeota archaeon]|nr:TIGR00270 family protein [Candidatus Micrarchaeota archaeon]MDE1824211.1 TIGR00270 family protein [Candidatus Micrarchaeota archaeon]MDE1849662.1 TIGR00270 family protein [Candidatus Micrarchaeota archaeon]
MADCEICGRDAATQHIIEIEGAQMSVCANCAKGKKVLEKIEPHSEPDKRQRQAKPAAEERELVDDYGTRIRHAREGMGLSLKVVAEKISEKESTLLRVEEEKMRPNDALMKKLEKELGIRLTESIAQASGRMPVSRGEPITLGDAVIRKDGKR